MTADWAVLGEPSAAESAPGRAPRLASTRGPTLVGDTAAYGPVEGPPGHRPGLARAAGAPRRPRRGAWATARSPGTWASEALRVAAWRPRLGFETDHRTIPHEVDWLRTAVHLHKGCYRGQETIARVHNLGRPPRRLVFLHLDGSGHVLPEPGRPCMPRRACGRPPHLGRAALRGRPDRARAGQAQHRPVDRPRRRGRERWPGGHRHPLGRDATGEAPHRVVRGLSFVCAGVRRRRSRCGGPSRAPCGSGRATAARSPRGSSTTRRRRPWWGCG